MADSTKGRMVAWELQLTVDPRHAREMTEYADRRFGPLRNDRIQGGAPNSDEPSRASGSPISEQ